MQPAPDPAPNPPLNPPGPATTPAREAPLDILRKAVARLEQRPAHTRQTRAPLPFGIPAIDAAIGGGIARQALHEVAGDPALAACFTAGLLARIPGKVIWVLERADLFAPALAAAGLHPDRVIYAQASRRDALLVMEDALRHRGLAAVVAETSARISLTASRRLLLAAEAGTATAILLRRPNPTAPNPTTPGADPAGDLAAPIAAHTRWRIHPMPSPPPIPDAPEIPGLGPAHWRLELARARTGQTGTWIVEACDASGHLALVAPLADRSAQAQPRRRRPAA